MCLDAERLYLNDTSFIFDSCTEFAVVDTVPDASAAAVFSACATQIVFDSGDVSAALAELAAAASDRTAPWRIRQCWLHESLRARLEDAFPEATAASGDDDLDHLVKMLGGRVHRSGTVRDALPLLVGVAPAQWSGVSDDVVLVQYFRTAREVLEQVARSKVTSVSAWTESLSLAFEVADRLPGVRNVWLNSVGLLNPKVPFTFVDAADGGTSRLYGTELAQCQAAIYDGAAETPSEEVQRRLTSSLRKEWVLI